MLGPARSLRAGFCQQALALWQGWASWPSTLGLSPRGRARPLPHARELLWDDLYFVAAISAGFGTQVGLFVYVRRMVSLRARGGAATATATGTGTSTAAMVACCAHHVRDALPVLGLSGAAIFLND